MRPQPRPTSADDWIAIASVTLVTVALAYTLVWSLWDVNRYEWMAPELSPGEHLPVDCDSPDMLKIVLYPAASLAGGVLVVSLILLARRRSILRLVALALAFATLTRFGFKYSQISRAEAQNDAADACR